MFTILLELNILPDLIRIQLQCQNIYCLFQMSAFFDSERVSIIIYVIGLQFILQIM